MIVGDKFPFLLSRGSEGRDRVQQYLHLVSGMRREENFIPAIFKFSPCKFCPKFVDKNTTLSTPNWLITVFDRHGWNSET